MSFRLILFKEYEKTQEIIQNINNICINQSRNQTWQTWGFGISVFGAINKFQQVQSRDFNWQLNVNTNIVNGIDSQLL